MNDIELFATFGGPIPVLDHGFVRVVDVMGNDAAIVQAPIPLPGSVWSLLTGALGLLGVWRMERNRAD